MNRYNYPWVVNEMNSTNLKSFKIFGLFDRYDVELPFDKQVNIFIGENGLGKTTILNCLYYVLQKKYSQLENIPFQQIEISFRNTSIPITISKADVISYNKRRNGRRVFMMKIISIFCYQNFESPQGNSMCYLAMSLNT